MAFRPSEICSLSVNGAFFRDWKTVLVYLCIKEANNYFRFTVSEGKPIAKEMGAMRIRPGDTCTVTLGGEYAIGGYIWTRQVAYTATHHGVELTGKSSTALSVPASAMVKGGEMTNVNYLQFATKILEPLGLTATPKDNISQEKIPRVNVHGQSVWEALEKTGRGLNINLGTNPKNGSDYWLMTPRYKSHSGRVVEGQNILEGREIISQVFGSGPYMSLAQAAPTPAKYGYPVTAGPFSSGMNDFAKNLGVGAMPMPIMSLTETPGTQGNADSRTGMEQASIAAEQIKVEVVVQGWFRDGKGGGGLWQPTDRVSVLSPMLIMYNKELICRSVTFTQDDRNGTRTTLELWNEAALGQGPSMGG